MYRVARYCQIPGTPSGIRVLLDFDGRCSGHFVKEERDQLNMATRRHPAWLAGPGLVSNATTQPMEVQQLSHPPWADINLCGLMQILAKRDAALRSKHANMTTGGASSASKGATSSDSRTSSRPATAT